MAGWKISYLLHSIIVNYFPLLRLKLAQECNIYIYIYIYMKVKWYRYRPDVAQKVGRVIALLFHDRGTRRGWVVSSTLRLHFTHGKDPVPILQEAGWAPGPVGKFRPHRDSIPGRPASSPSLYRLSYLAHIYICVCIYVCINIYIYICLVLYYVCLNSKLYHVACKKSNTESIGWQVWQTFYRRQDLGVCRKS